MVKPYPTGASTVSIVVVMMCEAATYEALPILTIAPALPKLEPVIVMRELPFVKQPDAGQPLITVINGSAYDTESITVAVNSAATYTVTLYVPTLIAGSCNAMDVGLQLLIVAFWEPTDTYDWKLVKEYKLDPVIVRMS